MSFYRFLPHIDKIIEATLPVFIGPSVFLFCTLFHRCVCVCKQLRMQILSNARFQFNPKYYLLKRKRRKVLQSLIQQHLTPFSISSHIVLLSNSSKSRICSRYTKLSPHFKVMLFCDAAITRGRVWLRHVWRSMGLINVPLNMRYFISFCSGGPIIPSLCFIKSQSKGPLKKWFDIFIHPRVTLYGNGKRTGWHVNSDLSLMSFIFKRYCVLASSRSFDQIQSRHLCRLHKRNKWKLPS